MKKPTLGLQIVIALALIFFVGIAQAALKPLDEGRYQVYFGDINSEEFGLDGYSDILLRPRKDFVLIASSVAFPISLDSGYRDILLCGRGNGSFSLCNMKPGAVIPANTSKKFDIMLGDFDNDGVLDIFLHSLDQNINSLYLRNTNNGAFSLKDQFIEKDGVRVSGNYDVSVTDSLGGAGAEILIDGFYYTELDGDTFGQVESKSLTAQLTGATPGSLNVVNGQLHYSIPIQVPKGPAGVDPSFSLNYSSDSGYGHAGMGFNLSGFSNIERCSHTYMRDGFVGGVDGSNNDLACLDGTRLVLVSGEYWENGSVYYPESGAAVKVVYDQGGFTANHKNGDSYKYGYSIATRFSGGPKINGAVGRWALEKVEDRLGYGYRINYVNGSAGMLPEKIDYLSGGADGSAKSIDFYYRDDSYWLNEYVFGKRYSLGKRLERIVSRSDSQVVRAWRFSYTENPVTGRALLKQFQECGLNSSCLEPSSLVWSLGKDKTLGESSKTKLDSAYVHTTDPGSNAWWVDFDNDGKEDFCVRVGVELRCHKSSGNSVTGNADVVESILGNTYAEYLWADIDRDGFQDFCARVPHHLVTGSNGKVKCFRNEQGGGFSPKWTVTIQHPVIDDKVVAGKLNDVNGDGVADYCLSYFVDSEGEEERVRCAFGAFDSADSVLSFSWQSARVVKFFGGWVDLDGNGLPDYCSFKKEGIKCHLNEKGVLDEALRWTIGEGVNFVEQTGTGWSSTGVYFKSEFVDFTGDGYKDYCRIYRVSVSGSDYRVRCLVNDGKDWVEDVVSPAISIEGSKTDWLGFFDVNQDGYTDWCLADQGKIKCQLVGGVGFTSQVKEINLSTPDGGVLTGFEGGWWPDISGNGVPEFCASKFTLVWEGDSYSDLYCFSESNSIIPDYLAEVKNGMGLEYVVEYANTTDAGAFGFGIHAGPGGAVPRSSTGAGTADIERDTLLNVNSAMRVVSHLYASNGTGGMSEQSYRYEDYGYYPNELGGVGFRKIEVTSEGGDKITETLFNQDAYTHQVGQPVDTKVYYMVGGQKQLVSENTNTFETVIYQGSGFQPVSGATSILNQDASVQLRYQVRQKVSVNKSWELDGSLVSRTTSENIRYNNYGDLEEQLVITTNGADQTFYKKAVTEFDNNEADWVLGRQKRTDVTTWGNYQGVAVSPITRASAWTYYGSGSPFQGMLKSEIVEPDRPDLRKETSYTYNAFGLKETATVKTLGVADRPTAFTYDPTGRFLAEEKNHLNHSVTHQYDPVTGWKIRTTGPNNLSTVWEYDEIGRPLREIAATGQSKETRYKACVSGCPSRATWYSESWMADINGQRSSPITREYKDKLGRTIETRTQGFAGEEVAVRTVYNSDGQISQTSEPFVLGTAPKWNKVMSRDVMGRPSSELTAAGLTTTYDYQGLTTRQTLTWSDSLGGSGNQTVSETLDVLGNRRAATDAASRTINYQYDGANQLTQVNLPGGVTLSNDYDHLGRKVASEDPNIGAWRYAYNGDDQLVLQQNGNGKRICTAYDSLGRQIKRVDDYRPDLDWNAATTAALDQCDGQVADTTWVYENGKGIGRLAKVSTSDGYEKEPFYDTYGRITKVVTRYDGLTLTEESVYDSITGRLARTTLPHRDNGPQVAIDYRYNNQGHLYEVGEAGNPDHYYWRVDKKTLRGEIKESQRANGLLQHVYDFDAASGILSQIRSKTVMGTGWNIQNEVYVHNAKGLMRKRTDALQSIEELFLYDDVDRMTDAQVTHLNDAALSYTQTPIYDAAGNISYRNDVGDYHYEQTCEHQGQSYTPGPYAVTRVSGERNASYCYDEGGNMLSGNGKTITYNAFNKPTQIDSASATVTFAYGPGRGLIKQATTANGKTVTKRSFGSYENLMTTESGQATLKERISLPGGVVISFENGDESTREESYLFTDALGSTVAVANALGQVTERYRYDPWGRPRLADWQAINDGDWSTLEREQAATGKGFTGHQMLDEVGIIHMGGRIYDPTLGRFMSADPIVKGLGNVESYNRYSYVLNSPMSFTDPSGYSWLSKTWKKLRNSIKKRLGWVAAMFVNPSLSMPAFTYREGGRELARFAARNKYAGEIIGVVGAAGCTFTSVGAPACMAAVQGWTSSSMTYGGGGSVADALFAGMHSGALAYMNASVAGQIGDAYRVGQVGFFDKTMLHGARGAFFAGLSGGGGRAMWSGFAGGITEGALAGEIRPTLKGWGLRSDAAGVLSAALLSGTVSEVTGGKFAVGAATGAMGYLANHLATEAAKQVVRERDMPGIRHVVGRNGHQGAMEFSGRCVSADCLLYGANITSSSAINDAWFDGQLVADLEAFSNIAAVVGFAAPTSVLGRVAGYFGWSAGGLALANGDPTLFGAAATGEFVTRQNIRSGYSRVASGRAGIIGSVLFGLASEPSNYVEY